jgi:hypothetical protein
LSVVLAPAIRGTVDLREWDRPAVIDRVSQPLMNSQPERRASAQVGYWKPYPRLSRLLLADSASTPRGIVAELYRDGLVAVSTPIANAPSGAQLAVARSHAFRGLCATLGPAVFLATAIAGAGGSDSLLQVRLDTSKVLVGDYDQFDRLRVDENGPRGEVLAFDHALDLDVAVTDSGYRAALLMVANTLWNGLGRAECPYLDGAGTPTPAGMRLLERH